MRTLNTLSFILYVFLFPFVLAVPVMLWIIGKILFNLNDEIPTYRFLGEEILTAQNPILLVLTLTSYLLVSIANAYGFILLYKIVEKFKKMQFFQTDVINHLKHMGYIFSIGFLIIYFIKPIIKIDDFIFINTTSNPELNLFIEKPLNGLIIGLFFLVLSKVFQIAKIQKEENIELKQENELTI